MLEVGIIMSSQTSLWELSRLLFLEICFAAYQNLNTIRIQKTLLAELTSKESKLDYMKYEYE